MKQGVHFRAGKCWSSRRVWLTNLAAVGFGSAVWRKAGSAAAASAEIEEATARGFMAEAFEMKRQATAAGDQAYGAVVVKDGVIVSAAPSRVVTNADPTAHAEMEALRDAAMHLTSRDLSGCILYSSSRPCPMCEAAAFWARIDHLYHGDPIRDGGAPSLPRC